MLQFIETLLFKQTSKEYLEHLKVFKNKLYFDNDYKNLFKIGEFHYVKLKNIETLYIIQIQKLISIKKNKSDTDTDKRKLRSKQNCNSEYIPNDKVYYITSSGRKTSKQESIYNTRQSNKINIKNELPLLINQFNNKLKIYGNEYCKFLSNQKLYCVKLLIRKNQMFVQQTKRNLESISQV